MRALSMAGLLLGFGACGAPEQSTAFSFEVTVNNSAGVTVSADSGTVFVDGSDFTRIEVSFASYEAALAAPPIHVTVSSGGSETAAIDVPVADCTTLCTIPAECDEFGVVVRQRLELVVEDDGSVQFDESACWSCDGTLNGVEACN